MNENFIKFIKAFIRPDKQERLIQFFKKEKNWWKLELEFHSSANFKQNALINITPDKQSSDFIYQTLKDMGAEDECYSLVDYLKGEKYEWNLKDKLDDSVGFLVETAIYCPNSGLGYFEGGHAKDRYILKSKN